MLTSHASAESPKSRLAAAMADLKLTVHAVFVPWSMYELLSEAWNNEAIEIALGNREASS